MGSVSNRYCNTIGLFDLITFLSQFLTDPKNDLIVAILGGLGIIRRDMVKMKIDIAKICQWKDDHEEKKN